MFIHVHALLYDHITKYKLFNTRRYKVLYFSILFPDWNDINISWFPHQPAVRGN